MVRDYELMYIVRPDLDEDALRAAVDSVRQLLESLGGEVVKTTMWGKRRLAYEVQHLRDGHYVILEVRLDGARVRDLERSLRIHETVFRHLLVLQTPDAAAEEEPAGEPGERLSAGDDLGAERAAEPAEHDAPEAETAGDEPAAQAEPEQEPVAAAAEQEE